MKKDSLFFMIIAILVLGLLWEPIKSQKENRDNSYLIEPPKTSSLSQKEEAAGNISPYQGKINVSGIYNLNDSDPNKEYIYLSTNLEESEKINVTGWRFKSELTGNYGIIGKINLLPVPPKNNPSDIILTKGDVLIINKGFSPIAISFRTNKCIGFLAENRDFVPFLNLECPRPINENLPMFSNNLDRHEECLDIIESIPICTTKGSSFVRDLPDTVSSDCKKYITTQINYDFCVAAHIKDDDFYGKEYRFYMNSFQKLWRDYNRKEKINLYDNNGLIVDTISHN